MRTSLTQQIQSQLAYINSAVTKLSEAQTHTISGKRILRASEDVSGTNRALSLRTAISKTDQFADNISVSKPFLLAAEKAVADLVKAVRSVRDIAVAAASPDVTGGSGQNYIAQLDNILNQMLDIANTKHMDQYVFSGTATDVPAVTLDASGNYVYTGDSGTRRIQILSWVSQPINIPGSALFNFDGSAGAGTSDLFAMVGRLKEAIAGGDAKAVSEQLSNIDANLDNLLTCSAKLGSWIARMDRAQDLLADTKMKLQEMLSDTEDIDLAKSITELKSYENIYQAALLTSSRILSISLANLALK